MFQFPRKFPELVSAMEAMAIKHPETVVKPEGEEEEEVEKKKKKTPPVWGTAGSRNAKAARWSLEQGQIGELLVRKSGRVTILINGDLEFEVSFSVPFLQISNIIDISRFYQQLNLHSYKKL